MDYVSLPNNQIKIQKFPAGRIVITRNARESILSEGAEAGLKGVETALRRHLSGDWGELEEEDLARNESALKNGGRLFSAYNHASGTRFWIITEADRSYTTILLPEDY